MKVFIENSDHLQLDMLDIIDRVEPITAALALQSQYKLDGAIRCGATKF